MSGVQVSGNDVPVREEVTMCSSSCPTKDHATFGACLRAKNLQLSPAVNEGYSGNQKAWDKELDNYESAVRQGLEPRSTKQWAVDQAVREADSA